METSLDSNKWAVQEKEAMLDLTMPRLQQLQIHIEDLDDRSWQNNVCIRGLPEEVITSSLKETVIDLLH